MPKLVYRITTFDADGIPSTTVTDPANPVLKSGSLSLSDKVQISKKLNVPDPAYNVATVGKNLSFTEDPAVFDDSLTLEYIKTDKTLNNLNLSAVPLENSNDYYLTSDPELLALNTIPVAKQETLATNHLLSNVIFSNQNSLDVSGLITQDNIGDAITPNQSVLNAIPRVIPEPVFESFNDTNSETDDSNVSDLLSSGSTTIVHNGETYLVGDEIDFKIDLDFHNNEDGLLLNTLISYKNDTIPENTFSSETYNDRNTWLSDYVNFLGNNSSEENAEYMSSHFLPNAFFNYKDNRWEYNIVENNHIEDVFLSTKKFNMNIDFSRGSKEHRNFFDFPNNMSDMYTVVTEVIDGLNAGQLRYSYLHAQNTSTEKLFYFTNDFLINSPVCFTSFYDRKNKLISREKVYNILTNSYGFPNSAKWKVNENHKISMSQFFGETENFLLETISFEGNLDIRAERPEKRGNIANTSNDYDTEEYFPGTGVTPLTGKIWDTIQEFNDDFYINKNESEYITAGINFYILDVSTTKKEEIQVPKLKGFRTIKKGQTNKISDFKNLIISNIENNVNEFQVIDKYFSDLNDKYYFNTVFNLEDFKTNIEYLQLTKFYDEDILLRVLSANDIQNSGNNNETIQFKLYQSTASLYSPETFEIDEFSTSIYSCLAIDEFNNIKSNKTNKFYYFESIQQEDEYNLTNNRYFINDDLKPDTEFNFDKFNQDISLNSENTKKIVASNVTGNELNNNKLISHNSICFIKTKNNNEISSQNLKLLNSDLVVQQNNIPDGDLSIDIKDLGFKVESNIKTNVGKNNDYVSETAVSVGSAYTFKSVKDNKGKYLLSFNYDNIHALFSFFKENNRYIYETADSRDDNIERFLGQDVSLFSDWFCLDRTDFTNFENPVTPPHDLESDILLTFKKKELEGFNGSGDYGLDTFTVELIFYGRNQAISDYYPQGGAGNLLDFENVTIDHFISCALSNPRKRYGMNFIANMIFNVNIFYHQEIMKFFYSVENKELYNRDFTARNILSKTFSSNPSGLTVDDYFFNLLTVDEQVDLFIKVLNYTIFMFQSTYSPLDARRFPATNLRPFVFKNLDYKTKRPNLRNTSGGLISEKTRNHSSILDLNVFDSIFLNQAGYYDYDNDIMYESKLSNRSYNIINTYTLDYTNILVNSSNLPVLTCIENEGFDFVTTNSFYEFLFDNDNNNLIEIEEFTPYTVETNRVDDEIVVLEGDHKYEINSKVFNPNFNNDDVIDITSLSGKNLQKSINIDQSKKVNYVINKSDEIAIGINSFNGINDIISYVRLKNNLTVSFKGRELYKIPHNPQVYSTSIKSSLSGNNRLQTKSYRSRPSEYLIQSEHNQGMYISDTVYPGIGKVYYDIALKPFVRQTVPDTLDYFLQEDLENNTVKKVVTNKILLSTKSYDENQKYDIALNDWHKIYYMSKYKENFLTKYIEDTERYVAGRGVDEDLRNFVYYDIDSYTASTKMSRSRGTFSNAKLFPISVDAESNKYFHTINNINDFILPKEFCYETVTDLPLASGPEIKKLSFKDDGIPFVHVHASDDIENFKSTKDVIIEIENNVDKEIENTIFSIAFGQSNLSAQYLQIPNITLDNFDDNQEFIYKGSKNNYIFKNKWCLVIQGDSVSYQQEKLNISDDLKFTNISTEYFNTAIKNPEFFDFVEVNNNENYMIVADSTFKLFVNKNSQLNTLPDTFKLNFYLIFDLTTKKVLYFVFPMSYSLESNSYINGMQSNNKSVYFNITFNDPDDANSLISLSDADKNSFIKSTNDLSVLENPYRKIPLSIQEVIAVNDRYIVNTQLQEEQYDFIIPKYNLKYPKNSNNLNPSTDSTSSLTLENMNSYMYDLNENNYIAFDSKLNSVSLEKFDFINNSNKEGYRLNKKLSTAVLYKKSGVNFIKTNNTLLYDVFVQETYNKESNQVTEKTYVSIYGVLNGSNEFNQNDIQCSIFKDIKDTDIIRIYDSDFMHHYRNYNRNYNVPHIEIDLNSTNTIFESLGAGDNEDISDTLSGSLFQDIKTKHTTNTGSRAIQYNFFSTNSSYTPFLHNENKLWTYGTPVCDATDLNESNKFLYCYSKNKKYSYPIDKVSGYRYGVQNHYPDKQRTIFNKKSYDQFADKTYDTQNYSFLRYENGKYTEVACVTKKYFNTNMKNITPEEAAQLPMYEGTNLDENSKQFYPYIESIDDSDLSFLHS